MPGGVGRSGRRVSLLRISRRRRTRHRKLRNAAALGSVLKRMRDALRRMGEKRGRDALVRRRLRILNLLKLPARVQAAGLRELTPEQRQFAEVWRRKLTQGRRD